MKSYRSPAIAILLAEKGVSDDIQLFRTGTFYHEQYGKFDITPEILKAMEVNFKSRVRGVDIAIDYKHDSEDIAAGWIKDVYVKNGNELWATVEWTPNGAKVLSEKEFRYISPEFMFDYQDNETLKKFGPVLLGAGLTNRPTIKKMEPVVLAEAPKYADSQMKGKQMDVSKMTPADIEKMSPDEMKAFAIQCLAALQKDASDDASGKEKEAPAKEAPAADKAAQDKMAAMEKELADAKSAAKCSEFNRLLAEGKVCKAQEEAFMNGDVAKFASLATSLKLNDGIGSGATPPASNKIESSEQAEDEVIKLAEEKIKANPKLDIGTAIRTVLGENEALNKKIYS